MKSYHRFSLVLTVCAVGTLLASAAPGQAYLNEVSRIKAQDDVDPVLSNPVLFIGSSSIRRWEQLTRDFADYNVLQRGFGGAQFDDINNYITGTNSMVLKYNPRAIVIWAGTNDLAGGSDGNEVTADYTQFVNTVLAAQPNVDIFYLGIMPTPGRQANRPKEDVANANIAAIAAGNSRLHYIDLPAAFAPLNPYAGANFLNKFINNTEIHLNRSGYEFWTSVIRPQIEAVVAPNKVYTPNPNTPQPGDRIYFDFGPNNALDGDHTLGSDVNGNTWNNFWPTNGGSNILPGEHIGGLKNSNGGPTGLQLTITSQFQVNGKRNGGLKSPNGPNAGLLGDLAIETATEDYFFSTADDLPAGGDDDIGGGFMLSGFNPDFVYDFRLFGTRESTETRITEYRLFGATTHVATLQTSGNNIGSNGAYDGNDDEYVDFHGVRPDRFGQIFFDQTLKQGAFAYIGAMRITVVGPAVPEPSSAILGMLGVVALLLAGRR